jgi:hypothetical protein
MYIRRVVTTLDIPYTSPHLQKLEFGDEDMMQVSVSGDKK